MYKTLEMMKSILNGKEGETNEKEIIKEYQEKLSPNILAYFYVDNFGLILQTSKMYPLLLNEDIASFCLQELDLCLQRYDLYSNIKFITYFSKCLKNRLRMETQQMQTQKRKINIIDTNCIDDIEISSNEEIEINDIDFLFNEYKLNTIEKVQSKLKLIGYTFKEIAKMQNLAYITVYKRNENVKKKILKSNINLV